MSSQSPSPTKPSPQLLSYRRRKQGLQRLPQPWDWITSAQASEMALQAFRAASWAYRDGTPGDFADALGGMFCVLVHAQAERAGLELQAMCDPVAEAQESLQAVPADWRHQYPRFGEPAATAFSATENVFGIRGPERSVGRGRSAPGKRGAN